MRALFIVHGNTQIGMGHVMRSLSLAEKFRERGHQVIFFSKYKSGSFVMKGRSFEVIECIDSEESADIEKFSYGATEELITDERVLAANISGKFDVILVDSYNVTQDFFVWLKKYSKCLVYIDDLNAFSYPVDILINGTAAAFDMRYEETQSARLLLGISYNLIRKEFQNLSCRKVNAEIKNVLITTGNSDPCDMIGKILEILREKNIYQDFIFHIIVGSGFRQEKWGKLDILTSSSVILHRSPSSMSEIMLKCDLAITAGGSTIYELAACGVPIIAFAYAENQIPQVMAMEREGLLQYIGMFNSIKWETLIEHIKYLNENYEVRRKLTWKLQSLVDAKGTLRIVKVVESMCSLRNE